MKEYATDDEEMKFRMFLYSVRRGSGRGFFPGKIEETDKTITIEGCRSLSEKSIVERAGVLLEKQIVITDLGTQKKNGHMYRSYEIKETEIAIEEYKSGG